MQQYVEWRPERTRLKQEWPDGLCSEAVILSFERRNIACVVSDPPLCCRNTSLNATYRNEIIPKTGNTGLLNFTNPQVPGPGSSACALNGLTYQDSNAMQEVIGELHELSLWNINVHPYHHHTQP